MHVPHRRKAVLLGGGVALWLLMIGAGMWWFNAYGFVPGASGSPGARWPSDSRVAPSSDGCTLVVALHPECPCSVATVAELDSLLARTQGRLQARLLMVQYAGIEERAEQSKLWAQAARLPGVTLLVDVDGAEARRFEARTSGETRLYARDGRLLFHGGITASRGQIGDNPGEAAVRSLVLHPSDPAPVSCPVFGCAL